MTRKLLDIAHLYSNKVRQEGETAVFTFIRRCVHPKTALSVSEQPTDPVRERTLYSCTGSSPRHRSYQVYRSPEHHIAGIGVNECDLELFTQVVHFKSASVTPIDLIIFTDELTDQSGIKSNPSVYDNDVRVLNDADVTIINHILVRSLSETRRKRGFAHGQGTLSDGFRSITPEGYMESDRSSVITVRSRL